MEEMLSRHVRRNYVRVTVHARKLSSPVAHSRFRLPGTIQSIFLVLRASHFIGRSQISGSKLTTNRNARSLQRLLEAIEAYRVAQHCNNSSIDPYDF